MKTMKNKPVKPLFHGFAGDEKGSAEYLTTVITSFVVMLFILLALNVFSLFLIRHDLGEFASAAVTEAAAAGRTDTVCDRMTELSASLGLDSRSTEYSFDGSDYIPGTEKVQLGDTIRLTVTCRTESVGSGIFSIPVSITVRTSAASERWWK